MKKSPPSFGQHLKVLRLNNKFSQEKLAQITALDRTYISLLERDQRQPTLKTLFRICEAIGIKPSDFISQIESQES